MNYTDYFYFAAKKYQNERNEREDAYSKAIESLKPFEGSQYYDERKKQLTDEFEAATKASRRAAWTELTGYLEKMAEKVALIPPTTPTTEQANLLSVLALRDHLTQLDIDQAAQVLKSCPMALKTLDDLAVKHGTDPVTKMPLRRANLKYAPVMTPEYAAELLKNNDGVKDFVYHNASRAARVASRHNGIVHGIESQEVRMARRKTFHDKAGCFAEIFGLDNDACSAFCEMVDAD